MSQAWQKLVLPVTAIVAVVFIVWLSFPRQGPPATPPVAGTCPQPPTPFFASAANVEIALTESIKVLKAQAEPKVLDAIPKEARTLEMIGFLTCKAKEQKLISSAADLIEYTKLLGDIQAGRVIAPFVRHLGKLANLERHLRTSPDNFVLLLDDASGRLAELEVEEISARDWPSWFAKFCPRYQMCVSCSPAPEQIKDRTRLTIVAQAASSEPSSGSLKCIKAQ